MTVKVKILRISEGSEHTAEIRGNVLHNEGKRHIPAVAGRFKDKETERQKGQESHIVCYQHRTDEGYTHERNNRCTKIPRTHDDLPGDEGKEAYTPERAYNGERAEKAGQRPEIEIPEIGSVRRHNKRGHDRRNDRNA